MGISRFFIGQTPMTGIANFVNTAVGDVDFEKSGWAKSSAFTMSQVIPASGLIRYSAQITDRIYRDPDGFWEAIERDIPILSKRVKPYTTPEGKPAERKNLDLFPPYSIGVDNKEAFQQMMDRRAGIEEKKWNDAETKRLLKDLGRGNIKEQDIKDFVGSLSNDEQARIKAKLRRMDEKWKKEFPIKSKTTSSKPLRVY